MAPLSLLSCYTIYQVHIKHTRSVGLFWRLKAEGTIVSSPVPSLKLPEPEKACGHSLDADDAKENGEVNSSTPPSSQSKSNPVTPAKLSPSSNHLNRPMSDSLRQKLKRRRPLHSPTTSATSSDELSGESPVKKQRTSLHGPPRNIHPVSTAHYHLTTALTLLKGEVSEREKERRLRVELFEKKSALVRLNNKIQTKKNSLAKRVSSYCRNQTQEALTNSLAQDEIEHLTALIDKWRSVCQEALMELLAHQNRHSIEPVSLGQLLQTFHIEPSLLHYAADIDAFK